MKLKTSFFNTSVLKKDITRFAPLWGIYTVIALLTLFGLWSDYTTPDRFVRHMDETMMVMGSVNFCYAGLAAFYLFGDLLKSRLCNALHAMPLRREGWFLTHTAAAMLFCLVPNTLVAVICAAMMGKFAFLAFLWLALMVMEFVCFFGLGVFSMLCAGSGLGAATVYGISNFLSLLVLWLAKCFYEPILFGVTIPEEGITRFSPVIGLCSQNYVEISFQDGHATVEGFVGGAWLYAGLAMAAGVALLVTALFLYRRRNLESAGDFISFRPAAPVFHILYTLCVGAILYMMSLSTEEELVQTVFLLAGLAIGWFTGKMLLEKRVNVFRLKTFVGLGVVVILFYLSFAIFWLDPLGITRYVPEAQQVQSVMVSPYSGDSYYNDRSALVTDPAQIEKITQIHQDLVDAREEDSQNTLLRLRYTLENGKEVERSYYLDADSPDGQWLKNVYSTTLCVLGSSDLNAAKRSVRQMDVYALYGKFGETTTVSVEETFEVSAEDWDGMMDAIAADCMAGNMTQIWEYHRTDNAVATLGIRYHSGVYREVQVYESCANTVAYIQALAEKLQTP